MNSERFDLATNIPPGSTFQDSALPVQTNRFGHIELRPKTTWLYAATFHSPPSVCDWEVFVSLTSSLGVCLPDTCLAWPSSSLISSVNVRTCEGHLPILLCESLPAPCLCQQLGTDSHPRAASGLHSRAHWAKAAHLPGQTASFACP